MYQRFESLPTGVKQKFDVRAQAFRLESTNDLARNVEFLFLALVVSRTFDTFATKT